jgi:hypothetical protein
MSSIGYRFDRESSSVFSVILPTGDIRPPDPHLAMQALNRADGFADFIPALLR